MITRAVLFERFVGRDAELSFLLDAQARSAREAIGAAVSISGEGGSGKSRLITEFMNARNSRAIVRVSCDGIGMSAYEPFAAAFRELATRRELAQLDSIAAARTSLSCGDALGASADESRARRQATIARALHEAAARLGGLTLVLEDAHWCDAGSLDAFAALVANSRRSPLLAVLTYRSDDLASDASRAAAITRIERAGADRIVLGPLSESDLLASLRQAVPGESMETLRAVCELADGKPLVAEELARNLVERGPQSGVQPPRSLRAAVLERVAQLESKDRAVIERAAVFGRALRLADTDVLGSPPDDVRAAMAAACGLQLIVETEIDGEPAFRFRHALTREILYRGTLAFERQILHREIAEALEARIPASRPADVAYHWWAARDPERARVWNERAADTALAVAALADAAELLGRAWAFAGGDADALARIGHRFAATLSSLARFDACIKLCADAAKRLAAMDRHDDALLLRIAGARARFDAYRLSEADAELSAVRRDLRPATAQNTRFELEIATINVRTQQGRLPEALDAVERVRAIAASLGTSATVRVLANEAGVSLRERDVDRAEDLLRRVIELARSPADAAARSSALLNLGGIAYYRGSPAGVIVCAQDALAFAKRTGSDLAAGRARSIIAHTACELGDFALARSLLADAAREGDTAFPAWSATELFLARATGEGARNLGDMLGRAEAALPDNYLLKNALRHAPWMLPPSEAAALVARLVPLLEDREIGDLVAFTVAAYGSDTEVARAVKTLKTEPRRNGFDNARERLVMAQLHARNHEAAPAREAALEALPFFSANGFWLLSFHAAHLAGDFARAHAILTAAGATAELGRQSPSAPPAAETQASPAGSNPASREIPASVLSPREFQIAQLLAAAHTNREISDRLAIALRTVETHAANIYEKLGVHSRTELSAIITKPDAS